MSDALARGKPRSLSIPRVNPVLLTLVVAAGAAILCLGFVDKAPNRLVSGQPVALWAAVGSLPAAAIGIIGAVFCALAFMPPKRSLIRAAGVLAAVALLIGVDAAGLAARDLLQGASAAARVSLGPAFWILEAAAALAIMDASQRLDAGPWAQLLTVAAIVVAIFVIAWSGSLNALSIVHEYLSRRAVFAAALLRHILLVAGSVGPALVVGFPLGIAAARKRALRGPLFAVLNLLQTVPSVALFGLLILPLSALARAFPALAAIGVGGIGVAPALVALMLYALLPIVRNTMTGLLGVDPSVAEAARGMGLTPRQLLWQIELPLALPVILAGLRIVTVQAIGLAVVAALIGAGGLGTFVFQGLGQYALDLVLLGALPTIFLALLADFAFRILVAILYSRLPR